MADLERMHIKATDGSNFRGKLIGYMNLADDDKDRIAMIEDRFGEIAPPLDFIQTCDIEKQR